MTLLKPSHAMCAALASALAKNYAGALGKGTLTIVKSQKGAHLQLLRQGNVDYIQCPGTNRLSIDGELSHVCGKTVSVDLGHDVLSPEEAVIKECN